MMVAVPAVLFLAAPALPRRELPNKWDVQISVESKGRYGLEGRDARYDGSFAFTLLWVGLMTRDDEDYLLVHNKVDIERWTAEERAQGSGGSVLLKTEDFDEKPELQVNYVLRERDGLRIDLEVKGFAVPRTPSAESFELVFPSSAGDPANLARLRYDIFIASGSNHVILNEKSFQSGPEVKKFRWTWRYRTWVPRADQTILAYQLHEAEVTVAVTPHEERSAKYPVL